ncbi:MAG: hypothetical protein CMK89_23600 [Pseudomonadales bacterium]|nr:hypothetical protein [Pseudomonadales bacterium]
MKDEKQDDLPVSDTDQQIIDYLDEMLQDPAAGQSVSVQPELGLVVPDNVAHFDVSKKKVSGSVPVTSSVLRPPTEQKPLEQKTPQQKSPQQRVAQKSEKPLALIDRPALLSESLLQIAQEKRKSVPGNQSAVEPAGPDEPGKAIPEKTLLKKTAPAKTDPEPAAIEPVEAEQEEADEVVLEGVASIRNNQWCENGRPQWAQSRFECLIFTVNGLKLAVPLVLLGSIHQIDRKFNALPGQYDWFIGILQTPNSGNIKVLDTGLCVMPERHNPESRDSLAYVITIHGYSWGLACHQVEKSITLEPEQVKWRSQRGKRPWLAGTVLDHMCSLVDTDGFQDIINQAEQSL